MEVLIEKVRFSIRCFMTYHRNKVNDTYIVRVFIYNRQVYGKNLTRHQFNLYRNIIKERITYIEENGLYDNDYTMVDVGNRMYRRVDGGMRHNMELIHIVEPCDYCIEEDYIELDLVIGCSLEDGHTYPDDALVFKYDTFYNNGNKIKTLTDLENDGVNFDRYDLDYNIPEYILRYLTWDYYSRDFNLYITNKVTTSIDKWY